MSNLPSKPANSAITESAEFDGVTLTWPLPSGGAARYGGAAFIMFWLCGWAFGWFAAAGVLLSGQQGTPNLFLAAWLGLWTIGGIMAMYTLWNLVRPARPESIWLGAGALRYDPGWIPRNLSRHNPFFDFVNPPAKPSISRPMEVSRSALTGFILDRAGDRQRLYFDRGADRVEIGATLREPEREWLFAVLRKWHSPEAE